jgi:hypothetical protein
MTDDKLVPVRCGECDSIVAAQTGGAIIIKDTHRGQKHVTVITLDRLLQEPSLRPSVKRV